MNRRYDAILFDMDGTLVPMDMDEFTEGYFKDLLKKCAPFNFDAKEFVAAIWKGTGAMYKNDGTRANREVFWETFEKIMNVPGSKVDPYCLDFYENEFVDAKRFTKDNPLAKKAVMLAHEKANKVVLATNPIFPMVGQITRMKWVDLKPEDFDLVTSYESDKYCKPNPKYFLSVCERINVEPKNCLLIGNDEYEDMYAATLAGLDCFLVTDTAIYRDDYHWEGLKGTFAELIEMLENL